MLLRSALFLVSVLVAVPACEREPAAPGGAEGPAFDWMNNPDNGNPRIIRFQDGTVACWSDATNGLRACHSTVPLFNGVEFDPDCGPQEFLDPVDYQQHGAVDPEDFFASWLHGQEKGQVWITVRDLTQPGTCFGSKLIAEGWGNWHLTDNDLFGTTDPNTNAFTLRAEGRLTTPEGATVQYNGHQHFTWSDKKDLTEHSSQVSIH